MLNWNSVIRCVALVNLFGFGNAAQFQCCDTLTHSHFPQVSELTHKISVLTDGILMMKSTLVGINLMEPKKLLEKGIRNELVRQLLQTMTENLSFDKTSLPKSISAGANLQSKLELIAEQVQGMRRSLEYIGDYVNTNGLKVSESQIFKNLILVVYHVVNYQYSYARFSKRKFPV